MPSNYDVEGYVITRRLIEDGRSNLVLRSMLDLPFPVRLLHGTADAETWRSRWRCGCLPTPTRRICA